VATYCVRGIGRWKYCDVYVGVGIDSKLYNDLVLNCGEHDRPYYDV
jgi:hypothetical protein